MIFRATAVVALFLLSAAGPAAAQTTGEAPGCWVRGERADLELRASPFDSAVVELEPGVVKVCYSRPRKLGRPIMGRLVPYGRAWRMGADEATAIHVPVRASIAGVTVEPGWYSLYAVPGEREWRIAVNADARRWGVPINDAVRRSDVGSGTVTATTTPAHVELLTFWFDRTGGSTADLVVRWEGTSVRIPIVLQPEPDRRPEASSGGTADARVWTVRGPGAGSTEEFDTLGAPPYQ